MDLSPCRLRLCGALLAGLFLGLGAPSSALQAAAPGLRPLALRGQSADDAAPEGATPILRFEEVLEAPLLGRDDLELAVLKDLIVHRDTGLVTRAVVQPVTPEDGPLKSIPYTELSWDRSLGALRIEADASALAALEDFSPARIARRSARWSATAGASQGSTMEATDPREASAVPAPRLLHLLAQHQVGRPLFRAQGRRNELQPGAALHGAVGTLYVAPTEGRIVAWAATSPGGSASSEVLLPWPTVAELPAVDAVPARLVVSARAEALQRLVRFAPRAPRDLGAERPRLRALFRNFGIDPPNVLLPPAERMAARR